MGPDRHLGRRGTLLGQKILVVDDEPNIVQSLAFVFNREGFDVATAGDGVQAMSMIRDSKPNPLILDIMMPNKNGYEVCQEIKSDPELKDIQVLMLSSISNENSRRHAMSQGADDYINKPFSLMQVVTRVKELLA
jgi:DNA-binding response OmpR family regulator